MNKQRSTEKIVIKKKQNETKKTINTSAVMQHTHTHVVKNSASDQLAQSQHIQNRCVTMEISCMKENEREGEGDKGGVRVKQQSKGKTSEANLALFACYFVVNCIICVFVEINVSLVAFKPYTRGVLEYIRPSSDIHSVTWQLLEFL